MSHPFHYLLLGVRSAELAPGNQVSVEILERHHLVHLADALEVVPRDATLVDLPTGVLMTPSLRGAAPPVFTWQPATQQWIDLSPQLRIGWEQGDLPTPEVLERRTPIPGIPVRDDVGQSWIIPIARSPRGRETLPADFDFDLASGAPRRVRKRCHEWLWELSGKMWDYWNHAPEDRDPALTEEWMIRHAAQILGVNYLVGPPELNAFRAMGHAVLDDVRAMAITLALIDFDWFSGQVAPDDAAKKNEAPALGT